MSHNAQNAPAELVIAGVSIRQDAAGRYCLNDLHHASGGKAKHKPCNWLRARRTAKFIELLKAEQRPGELDFIESKQGTGSFVCLELVYGYAMWISPAFKIEFLKACSAMNANLQAKSQPEPEITEVLAESINYRSFLISVDAKQALTQRAHEYLQLGHTEAEAIAWIERQPLGEMRLVRTEDLNPLADRVADLFNALSAVMDGHTEPRRGFPA